MKMPEMNGIETLKEIKRLYPVIEVILLTGYASFQTTIKAMTYGAFDYLTKPCDLEELAAKVGRPRRENCVTRKDWSLLGDELVRRLGLRCSRCCHYFDGLKRFLGVFSKDSGPS